MLAVAMVVRNEADRHLRRTLACVERIAPDLFFVTDDFSEDGTASLCLDAGPELTVVRRPQGARFLEHEGRFRQEHLDELGTFLSAGDWVLHLDADETVSRPEALRDLTEWCVRRRLVAADLPLYEFWSETEYRTDGYWFGSSAPRLFEWQPGAKIADKEMACGSVPTYVEEARRQGKVMAQTSMKLLHWGYLNPDDRLAKWERYRGRPGHSVSHVDSIIRPAKVRTYDERGV
jgi:Glycosyl transferase family 2